MKKTIITVFLTSCIFLSATNINIPAEQSKLQENSIIENDLITTTNFKRRNNRYYWNFEDNDGGFVSNNPTGWQWGIPSYGPSNAYSGDKLWGTVLDNDYPNGANLILETPESYLIPLFSPILCFWHWYEIESSWDGGNVKVSSDGGLTWSVIEPVNGYTGTANTSNPLSGEPIFCGTGQGYWEYEEFDLSSYAGQNLIFRWHFGSDNTVTYSGWYIDEVAIMGYSSGFLFGTVTEFGTGIPVEGATVSIIGTELSSVTQADGFYDIWGTFPGVFDISCVAPLYLYTEELNFSITNFATTLDFSLLWSEISVYPDEITFTLPPDTLDTISFTITNNGPGDLEYSITPEYTDIVNLETFTPNCSKLNCKNLSNNKNNYEVKRDSTPNVNRNTNHITDDTWLGMITNVSGTVPGNGGSVVVIVPINTADLVLGEMYEANLVIQNNSNYGGDFILPITLIVESVNVEQHLLPLETNLIGCFPNPFNPSTTIEFNIEQNAKAEIEIFNIKGQKIKSFNIYSSTEHSVVWNGDDENSKPVTSGIYYYKLNVNGNTAAVKKCLLLK